MGHNPASESGRAAAQSTLGRLKLGKKESSGADTALNPLRATATATLSLDQRQALYKLSRHVKDSFHPASMGSSNNTEDRGDWLFKHSNPGCAGL